MRITVTGGSGLIGRKLIPRLEAAGHQVHLLGRRPRAGVSPSTRFTVWDPERTDAPASALDGCGAVIHLAGEPVAQRWSGEVKRRIRDSRVAGTERLIAGLAQCKERPSVLVCASAVGFYGDRGDSVLTEESPPGTGFLPEVCAAWEQAARKAEGLGIRVVTIRIGVVLAREGGALDKMLPAFKFGAGGKLGSGSQYMAWIHVDDLVSLFVWALENPNVRGPVNGVSPNPATNAEFTAALGRALRRPAVLPVPKFAVQALFGEMSQIMFNSQRARPAAALAAGFEFRHPDLLGALTDVVS